MSGSPTTMPPKIFHESTVLNAEVDYYFDQNGMMIFTEAYHRRRGYCCENACRHCPFGYPDVPEQFKKPS